QYPVVITSSEIVRAHPLREGESPLESAGVEGERVAVPLPVGDGLTLASDHQLGADHQDLDVARIDPREGDPADQRVPLHRNFRLRVPTARPQPAWEEALPAAEEAVQQGINIPLQPDGLPRGRRRPLRLWFITDGRGRGAPPPKKGEEVFEV